MAYCIIDNQVFQNYNRAHKWSKKNGTLETDVIIQLHPTGNKTWVKYSFQNWSKFISTIVEEKVKKKSKKVLTKKEV